MKPILFNTERIKASQDGRKTQTRRPLGLEKINKNPDDWYVSGFNTFQWYFCNKTDGRVLAIKCPYGQVGDRLWVRETWQVDDWNYPDHPNAVLRENIEYRADALTSEEYFHYKGWRPSIFMPR